MDVKQIYNQLLREGRSKKDAAKEAQERTGMSAVTGRPINKQLYFTKTGMRYGQYGDFLQYKQRPNG
jgi:hypothetical protein